MYNNHNPYTYVCRNYGVTSRKKTEEKIHEQDKIEVIESPVKAVRQLPDVYIGALGNHGFLNMFREILQNSLDEIIKGNTLDKNIIVSFDSRTKTTIIEDNGQGIELDKLDVVFSVLHSSSNYNKQEGSGRYSSGKNGMGGTITNFLSEFFIAESYRMDGTASRVEFKEGELIKKSKIKCPKGKHGMIITFKPSAMMGNIEINEVDIFNLISLIVPLCKIGTKVVYNSINNLNQKNRVIIENKVGITGLMTGLVEKPVFNDPIHFMEDNGTMKVEVLLSYDVANMDDPKIIGFANMCPTDGGTHIDGFLDAVVKYFRDYMNKIYLANNKKKLQVNAQDIRTGLRAVVSIFHLFPVFTGQSKEIFSKEDIKPYIYNATLNALNEWAKNSPTELQKTCKYLKDVCEIRTKQDGEKIKMSDKYSSSVITGLPDTYEKPFDDKDFEVIIVEGKSAKSGAVNNRDKWHQGLFPVRGKVPNAFTKSRKDFFDNAEIAGMFKIFGYNGYQRKFDPDKFKPKRVIIMTDADPDGAHIRDLIFSLFLVYLPFVIEQGKLFFVEPPLYGLTEGKKTTFFNSQVDYVKFVQAKFCKKYQVDNISTKKQYSNKDLTNILVKNTYYKENIDIVSSRYAINPYLLEFILFNINNDYKKFKKIIESNNRFLKVTQENGITMIRGLYDQVMHTIFVNDRLLNDPSTKEALDLIKKSEEYYIINGEKKSLYALVAIFKSFMPNNIARYKGLGEMPPALLGESTIIPGHGRTLKQYTIKDAAKLQKELREMQSDKSAFLKGVKITREDIE
jgi:DNA gyrase/topoisomerase IV subunit B